MNETTKAAVRRARSTAFRTRYFVGDAIDIGAGDDSLARYVDLFPALRSVRGWDLQDGDAQVLAGIDPASFDLVYSSHCLEHMADPAVALARWWDVLKAGGYLVVVVPDEDLYEQGVWPSTFNRDHKHTFTVNKSSSWSPVSRSMVDLLAALPDHDVVKVERIEEDYVFDVVRLDQTQVFEASCCIEAIIRKRPRDG